MFKKIAAAVTVAFAVMAFMPIPALAVERHEVLQIGDEDSADSWVYDFQKKLNDMGYLKTPATGYFGTDTQAAVIQFQTEKSLAVDGKAGPDTRKAIYGGDYFAIDNSRSISNRLASQTQAPAADPSTSPSSGTANALNPGDKGSDISKLQQRLKDLEYYDYSSITGYYGPVTTEAVKKFQRTNGLEANGAMTADSLTLLYSEGTKFYTMYPQDSGDDIKSMQDRLSQLGYFEGSSTGYFGSITTNAVKRFQDANGLSVDGVVGKNTRGLLYSDSAKSAPGGSSSESSNNSSGSSNGSSNSGSSDSGSGSSASSSNSTIQRVLDVANSQMNKPYSYGSSGPNSYDCSGFVYYCLKNSGVATGRLSSAGYSNVSGWQSVSDMNSLSVGDLIYFKSDKSSVVSHIGIYIGGGSMIHCAPSSNGVNISSISSGYYNRNFLGAKRFI
ncbi:MAG: peptidoglycan-binding protein [Christensenella sp.]|uniref:C40 family peptidase n=1 Tax=Christensenella sp. TaxID=1935934 RepID=UPI002B2140BD|nr:peptidoglycan-binding protein [Christensenella sp.]MEA5002178.1 peptidoglycan-binding protein [Christensenella sp.]